jgi:PadR family transcriptional regulator PadR
MCSCSCSCITLGYVPSGHRVCRGSWPFSLHKCFSKAPLSEIADDCRSLPLVILLVDGVCSPCMPGRSDNTRVELLQGTLDLLILRTIILGPLHGHAIAKAIERNSDDVLVVEQGSLYPALHRLMKRNFVSAEDGVSESNRKARFYRLTSKGQKQLALERTRWEKLARAIGRVLQPNN